MHYNIHTHFHPQKPGRVSIENLYKNFDQDLAGKTVSMGLHPWYLDTGNLERQLLDLKNNTSRPEVLAIGECGLDKLSNTDWELQLTAFQRQISFAQEIQKPIIIHCVKAFNEVLAQLKGITSPVIFHGINNKLVHIQPIINAGYYLSFGKSVLSNNEIILDTFRATPLEQIFLETDDTDLDILEIYKTAARIKNIDEKDIVLQLEKNFEKVFG